MRCKHENGRIYEESTDYSFINNETLARGYHKSLFKCHRFKCETCGLWKRIKINGNNPKYIQRLYDRIIVNPPFYYKNGIKVFNTNHGEEKTS